MNSHPVDRSKSLHQALWRLYYRPERPLPWVSGGNLPWNEPDFSERMLREHLDQTHGAASRTIEERTRQLPWLIDHLSLGAGSHLLDVTCGPGLYAVALAEQGIAVTGVDFAPAAVEYARRLAHEKQVQGLCTFIEADIHQFDFPRSKFDAAMVLYGQLAVMTRDEAQVLLNNIFSALKPGGRIVLELLDPEKVDRTDSTWWFTDDRGLWGDSPFLCLGERSWRPEALLSMERYYVFHLEDGRMDEIILCDQVYPTEEMIGMLAAAGFEHIEVLPLWGGVKLADAEVWVVYKGIKKA